MLTALEKEEDTFKMSDAAASMDFLEEAKRAMRVLGEEMTSVCYINDADFCDLEEPHEAGAGGELAKSEDFYCETFFTI